MPAENERGNKKTRAPNQGRRGEYFWKILNLYNEGRERKQIAFDLGIKYERVAYNIRLAVQYGLITPRQRSCRTPDEVVEQVYEEYLYCGSVRHVADTVKVPYSTAMSLILRGIETKELKAPRPSRSGPGVQFGHAKRRARTGRVALVERMADMYFDQKLSADEIAEQFGYTNGDTVRKALRKAGYSLRSVSEALILAHKQGRRNTGHLGLARNYIRDPNGHFAGSSPVGRDGKPGIQGKAA